jgi:hypothetical protein
MELDRIRTVAYLLADTNWVAACFTRPLLAAQHLCRHARSTATVFADEQLTVLLQNLLYDGQPFATPLNQRSSCRWCAPHMLMETPARPLLVSHATGTPYPAD